MEVSNQSNIVTITGNIKSFNDLQMIRSTIDSLIGSYKNIIINILDSISMTSSVLGYLNKILFKDGINLTLNIYDEKLISLFSELNLTKILNVKRLKI